MGCVLAIALVVVIALVSYRNTRKLVETNRRMSAHTQELLAELEALRSAIIDAQHGSRDYVLTGDEGFLKQHEDSVSQIHTHLQRLQDLTADNHDQQERIVALDRRINERLLAYDEIINKRKASGAAMSQEVLNSIRDKTARAEVSLIVTEVVHQVNDFMRTQSENAERSASNTVATLTALALLALILFSAASYLIRRDISERKRVEESLERRTKEITLLSQMGSFLQACMTTEEAYNVIAEFAPQLFPTAPGAVCVLSASRNLVEVVASWGGSTCEAIFTPDACWALRSGRVHYVDEPGSPVTCRHLSDSHASSYLCVPMMAQGDALGILHIQGFPSGNGQAGSGQDSLTASKQQLAFALAEQIGLALANLKLRETLRTQSIRDPLTGLYNRRYMEESLERELRRAARNRGTLGAIMLDLDHFKRYNDTFGHDAGDSLLRELGNFLQTQVRGEDIACRFGGEEFVLILPDASLEATELKAEQLREGVKHLNPLHRGQPLGPVTLSLGVALFPEHAAAADALFRSADEALYQAKAQGRDRVVIGKPVQHQPA